MVTVVVASAPILLFCAERILVFVATATKALDAAFVLWRVHHIHFIRLLLVPSVVQRNQSMQDETELISDEVDIEKMFGISRTPRRTAVSRTKNAGYDSLVSEINRWRTVENAQGQKPRQEMKVHYAEAVLMMPTT